MGHVPVAIVHDYLTQRGGAERVVLSLLRAFPGSPLFTSVYEPDATFPQFRSHDVRPIRWLQQRTLLRRDHRAGLLVYPLAFRCLRVDADVVICSTSGFAHAVRTPGHKIVYAYNPPRWLWQPDDYLPELPAPVRVAARAIAPALRRFDARMARTADRYLVTGAVVAERVERCYGIEAEIIHPPFTLDPEAPRSPIPGIPPGFFLTVARLRRYKNVEPIVETFARLPEERLVVVADGPDLEQLRSRSPSNTRLLSRVSDGELRWLYHNTSALIAMSHEDFGLTPIEAAAFGRPTVALRAGGYLETVVDGATGVFVEQPTVNEIAAGCRAVKQEWDPAVIQAHAAKFGESRFIQAVTAAAATPLGH